MVRLTSSGKALSSATHRVQSPSSWTVRHARPSCGTVREFVLLHPMRECAGLPCRVEKVDGTVQLGEFPKYISPHQPFIDVRAISHEVAPNLHADVRFDGDIFEMEDQRNWTDASYKTYCTPLRIPYPVEIRAGTKISQSVTLTLKNSRSPIRCRDTGLTFSISSHSAAPLPRIGLGVAHHGKPLTQKEVERLKKLNLSHLRVDVNLTQPNYESTLRRANSEAKALGVPLEIALTLSDAAARELNQFGAVLDKVNPAIFTWLIFHIDRRRHFGKMGQTRQEISNTLRSKCEDWGGYKCLLYRIKPHPPARI